MRNQHRNHRSEKQKRLRRSGALPSKAERAFQGRSPFKGFSLGVLPPTTLCTVCTLLRPSVCRGAAPREQPAQRLKRPGPQPQRTHADPAATRPLRALAAPHAASRCVAARPSVCRARWPARARGPRRPRGALAGASGRAADGRGLPAAGPALAHLAHGRLRALVRRRNLLLKVAEREEVDAAARRVDNRHAPLACARARVMRCTPEPRKADCRIFGSGSSCPALCAFLQDGGRAKQRSPRLPARLTTQTTIRQPSVTRFPVLTELMRSAASRQQAVSAHQWP